MNLMLARQPIFDDHERIIGYQIYHHVRDADAAPHSVLDAILETGLERLAGKHIAFVEANPEVLLGGAVELLAPAGVVLVLDGALDDPRILERCRHYHERGYHFAVNAPPSLSPDAPLLELAEVARLDVRAWPRESLSRFVEWPRSRPVHLLAEGVENARLRDECLQLGFRMFQGDRFNQPEIVSRRDLAVEHLQAFRLLKDIRNPDVEDAQIVESFRHDPGLTYRFLRVVNSAAVGGNRVDSIGYAIRLMGREALSRWLSLLLLSPFTGRGVSAEIASSAVIRARFCELVADRTGRPWATDALFTIGLFSRLDLLLETPLEDIVEQVAFSDEVRGALLTRLGPDGEVLALVEAYEAGRWDEVNDRCEALGIAPEELSRMHFSALPWGGQETGEGSGDGPPSRGTGAPEAAPDLPAGARGRLRRWVRSLLASLRLPRGSAVPAGSR